jgi:beta-galactosidase
MKLGVCYYPEQWPESRWAADAKRMREIGISVVRIAEFAWSRLEPDPGRLDWAWLDRAVETLHAEGLGIVMCTPTATPPKWLVDAHPDILAVEPRDGRVRGFGSRRHYCFSSPVYREQSRRITRLVAERYGRHPAVVAWQTDNEYGCHDTVLSASPAAQAGFRRWLAQRYGQVAALNAAWGTVFWSQEYRHFDEVDLPVGTVTEANPSHRLDWRRFASDEVAAFNREQVHILREASPGRPVSHNFMGFFTEFNHHDVAADLDIATWDSYPLGFTQNFFLTAEEKVRWARTGHPDIPAFHHDLYRGLCAGGRWWVMEQQPGPVNWAQWNPAPLDGMVRLWTWQAFAHGAEVVSYFRWRQAPFAQEQNHTGLLRPDASEAEAAREAAQVAAELRELAPQLGVPGGAAWPVEARVALVFDYDALWMSQIQPQGADYNGLELAFRVYSALRSLGLDVDIVSPRAALGRHALVVLPVQLHVPDDLVQRLAASRAQLVLGPRTGSKTADLQIPEGLAPGPLRALAGLRVERVSSLPPGCEDTLRWSDGSTSHARRWREDLVPDAGTTVLARFADDDRPALVRRGRVRSVAAWLDEAGWTRVLREAAQDAGLAPQDLPEGVRVSRAGGLSVVCNFSNAEVAYAPPDARQALLGGATLAPCGVAIWKP